MRCDSFDGSHYLKEKIEYSVLKEEEFQLIVDDPTTKQFSLELNSKEFTVEKIFRDEEVENFGRIFLDLKIQSKHSVLMRRVTEIQLSFNHSYYDCSLRGEDLQLHQDEENNWVLRVNRRLKNHSILDNPKILVLDQLSFFCADKIKVFFEKKMPLYNCRNYLKFTEKKPFSMDTNLKSGPFWNKDNYPLYIEITKQITNQEDYDFQDFLFSVQYQVNSKTNQPPDSTTQVDLFVERDGELAFLSQNNVQN